ncbi:MAG: TlpA disulfide reductase family protein [Pseudomonadota bacterium]
MRLTFVLSIACASLLAGCGDDTPRTPEEAAQKALSEAAKPAIGQPIPEFSLERLHGGNFDNTELRGKTTLLNFWAPWCAPCVQELPELSRLHNAIKTQGGQVIGIAIDRKDGVQTFIADHPVTYPLLLGGKNGDDLARRMGNGHGGLPYSVVIDADGIIRAAHAGRLTEAQARNLLESVKQ